MYIRVHFFVKTSPKFPYAINHAAHNLQQCVTIHGSKHAAYPYWTVYKDIKIVNGSPPIQKFPKYSPIIPKN